MDTQVINNEVNEVCSRKVFPFRQILSDAIELFSECEKLMDDPKAVSELLCKFDKIPNNPICNIIVLMKQASTLTIKKDFFGEEIWPDNDISISDLNDAKVFFNDPRNNLDFHDVGEALFDLYFKKHALFHLRLKLESEFSFYEQKEEGDQPRINHYRSLLK